MIDLKVRWSNLEVSARRVALSALRVFLSVHAEQFLSMRFEGCTLKILWTS